MSPTSLGFAFFIVAGLVIYYAFPKKARWCVLLAMSLVFYASGGWGLLPYLGFTAVTTYIGGILLGALTEKAKPLPKEEQKGIKIKKKTVCGIVLVLNFGLLFLLKYLPSISPRFVEYLSAKGYEFVLPLGISFYIFMTAGYVIDVYRGKVKVQRNFAKYLLFVSFFPQMIQGPIGRYGELAPTLSDGNDFSFDNMKEGLTLIALGLFKKLAIADRASVPASAVIDGTGFSGGEIFSGVIFYCIQLYFDFSGGIDLVRGVALLFGVRLAENFRRPVFAKSLTDFWRRWHITLGAWMKDYVFYPITLSKLFTRFARAARKVLKGRAAKILPVSLATFIIYFAIGVWHGGSGKYILYGFWNGAIITASLLMEPIYVRMKNALHINDTSKLYGGFCMLRTMLLVFIGRYITRAADIPRAFSLLKTTFTDFSFGGVFSERFMSFGLSLLDYFVIFGGVLAILIFEYLEERGKSLGERLEKYPYLTAVFQLAAVSAVIFLGVYRGSHISPDFIYKQF